MYNQKIENLITFAIADGSLDEKEKQILIKAAVAEGIDPDEFEMVLNGKLFEKQQSLKQASFTGQPAPAPKSEKYGSIMKCPACGATVEAFSAICADCSHQFNNIDAVSSVTQLYKELMRVEEEERNRAPRKNTNNSLTSFVRSSAADNILEERRMIDAIFARKTSVISAFPVPNSKSDILEFMIMAVAEGGKKIGGLFSTMPLGEKDYIKAWRAKAEQVVGKARFSLREDKRLLEEINEYAKKLEIK